MSIKMDLKQFKHVKSDKNSTTLQHKDGHMLTLAHGALSPEGQAQLKAIKMADGGSVEYDEYGYPKKGGSNPTPSPTPAPKNEFKDTGNGIQDTSGYAKGGPVVKYAEGTKDDTVKAPDVVPDVDLGHMIDNVSADVPQQSGASGTWDPDQAASQVPVDPSAASADPTAPQGMPANPAPAQVLAAKTAPPPGVMPQGQAPMVNPDQLAVDPSVTNAGIKDATAGIAAANPQATKDELTKETNAFANDIANGHITPKTYGDLYGRLDTPHKIGALFSMLVAGAGSGLTHQPNVVMSMMDKVIDNDLKAQQDSKTNAMNFLRIHQAQQLQQADLPNKIAQGKLTQAQAQGALAEARIKSFGLAKMTANVSAIHQMAQLAAKYPQGSKEYNDAQQALAMASQAADMQNANISDQVAAKTAWLSQAGINMSGQAVKNPNAPQAGPANAASPGGYNSTGIAQQLRKMQAMGTVAPEQVNKANEELKLVENKNQVNQSAMNSFDRVSKLQTMGAKLSSPIQNQKQIDVEWNPMMDKVTKDTEGRVTPITVDMMASLKPKLTDSAAVTNEKRTKFNEILNAGYSTPVLDSLNLSPPKGAGPAPQTETVQGKDGRSYQKQVIKGKTFYVPVK